MVLNNYRNIFKSTILYVLVVLLFSIVGCSSRKAPKVSKSKSEQVKVESTQAVTNAGTAVSEDFSNPSSLAGKSMEDVTSLLGKPKGKVTKEGKIVWLYDNCMVFFEDSKDGKRVSSVLISD